MSWLTGWQYRKKVTIAGSSGAGTNYQVKIKGYRLGCAYRTVATTTANWGANGCTYQRHIIKQNGLYWYFYSDGTNIVYRTSSDGDSWSSPTTVRSGNAAYLFSIACDGTHIAYVFISNTNNSVRFRMGTTNSDGTITWLAAEQVITSPYGSYTRDPHVCFDSEGYPWIAWGADNGNNSDAYGYVDKSTTKDGTWNSPSGFPKRINSSPFTTKPGNPGAWSFVVPLTNQKVYAITQGSNAQAKGLLWDGTTWGDEETVTTFNTGHACMSYAVTNDEIHITSSEYGTNNLKYRKRTASGWGTEETIHTYTPDNAQAVLTKKGSDLYVFWQNRPTEDVVYYKRCVNGTWDTEATEWFMDDNIRRGYLTVIEKAVDDEIVFGYPTGKASPYTIKVAFLPVRSQADSTTVLSFNDHCKSDFGDVRFTTSDSTTLLNYYIEKKVDNDSAIFWVRIPDNLDSDKDIYCYYGNPGAEAESNADDTFIFYDDFESGNLDKWSVDPQGGSISIVTDSQEGQYAVEFDDPVRADYPLIQHTNVDECSCLWTFWLKFPSNPYGYQNEFYIFLDFDGKRVHSRLEGDSYRVYDTEWHTIQTLSTNTWYKIEWQIDYENDTCKCYINDVDKGSYGLYVNSAITKRMRFNAGNNQKGRYYIDSVSLRKFVSPEPYLSYVWGEETTQLTSNLATAWKLLNVYSLYSSWRLLTEGELNSQWRIFEELTKDTVWQILTTETISRIIEWKLLAAQDISPAWKLLSTSEVNSQWKILDKFGLSSSWKLLTLSDEATAWKILSEFDKEITWKLLLTKNKDISWQILVSNIVLKLIAWKLITYFDVDATWKILDAAERDTSWKLLVSKDKTTAWKLLTSLDTTSAWRLLSEFSRQSSWKLITTKDKSLTWQILLLFTLSRNLMWKLITADDLSFKWKILTSTKLGSSWKLFNWLDKDTSWKILDKFTTGTIWKILNEKQKDLSWKLFGKEIRELAWSILSEIYSRDVAWKILKSEKLDTKWLVGLLYRVSREILLDSQISKEIILESNLNVVVKK